MPLCNHKQPVTANATNNADNAPGAADLRYQEHILEQVSRTFALTIPQLPPPAARVVGNAYLLCRIADTIEDDKHLPFADKRAYSEQFIQVVDGAQDARQFAETLSPKLSASASESERDLIRNTASVIRVTHSFNQRQQASLRRCVRVMAEGMVRYQETNVAYGLADLRDMDRYCYHVAGVVGEMLTELFCDYSEHINRNYDELLALSVSFGQGLQMTNILKDIWDDQTRNTCWLPRSILASHGIELSAGAPLRNNAAFRQALAQLIGIAHGHLKNALRYTLLLPRHEVGIRRFCLWALGMAVLTLRKINAHRHFVSGDQVKISRRQVRATIVCANLLTRHDRLLKGLFSIAASTLPGDDGST